MKTITALLTATLAFAPIANAESPHHSGRFNAPAARIGPAPHMHDFGPRWPYPGYGGRWVNGFHDGRFAWWWVLGDGWYPYPDPFYSYPAYAPPIVVQQFAPPPAYGAPPTQSWYFCDSPRGYYPYVAFCDSGWRSVPAAPPASTQPPH
ncbi:MAG: hypothetical protein QM773_06800 [Hyphomonadaceae bacterium]